MGYIYKETISKFVLLAYIKKIDGFYSNLDFYKFKIKYCDRNLKKLSSSPRYTIFMYQMSFFFCLSP